MIFLREELVEKEYNLELDLKGRGNLLDLLYNHWICRKIEEKSLRIRASKRWCLSKNTKLCGVTSGATGGVAMVQSPDLGISFRKGCDLRPAARTLGSSEAVGNEARDDRWRLGLGAGEDFFLKGETLLFLNLESN